MIYNPRNWYWAGTPQGQSGGIVYSSAAGAVVPATDPGYAAFLAAGARATPWPKDASGLPTTAALDVVLEAAGLPPTGMTAPTQAQLAAYASAKEAAILTGGVTVNIAPAGQPALNIECATDSFYLTLLNGAVQRSGLAPSATVNWQQRDNSIVALSAAQIQAVGLGVANWAQSVIDAGSAVALAIAAGTITASAQIDDPTKVNLAAWPLNS